MMHVHVGSLPFALFLATLLHESLKFRSAFHLISTKKGFHIVLIVSIETKYNKKLLKYDPSDAWHCSL